MQTASIASKLRRATFFVAFAAGAAATARWLSHTVEHGVHAWARGGPKRPDEMLVPFVALAALLGILWLGWVIMLELLARLPGGIGEWAGWAAARLTPRQVRTLTAALLGIGITAGVVPDASAGGLPPPPHTAPSPVPAAVPDPGFSTLPDPGWVPAAPTVRPQPDVRVLSPAPRPDPPGPDVTHEVVVHRGDSLWAITARHLGPDASDGEIAEAWPKWYAANRHVIGSDPDLLLPGQVLRAPERVGP